MPRPVKGVTIVQLPFPSQAAPLPVLADYYEHYERTYRAVFPEYFLGEDDLWEMPLWVAHLDGALGRDDTQLADLSRAPADAEHLIERLHRETPEDHVLFFSPLAQNFDLAGAVSRGMMAEGRRTAIGGNMADLAKPEDFTWVHVGLIASTLWEELTQGPTGVIGQRPRRGPRQRPFGYRPSYRLLKGFGDRVPLVRLNASHGCLFACSFCGDAWSRQLHEVPLDDLRAEVEELSEAFPNARTMYIGDKTFGQSRTAVENLKRVLTPDLGYKLVVQTHVAMVKPWVLDAMEALGVAVVEIGFETASSTVIQELRKGRRDDGDVHRALQELSARGLRPVLNVLGGLPNETEETQLEQLRFLKDTRDDAWLYNLYNFVPYPKTPLFPLLRDRIVDWDFSAWREDAPVVFEPFHQSRESSWAHFLALIETASSILADRSQAARGPIAC